MGILGRFENAHNALPLVEALNRAVFAELSVPPPFSQDAIDEATEMARGVAAEAAARIDFRDIPFVTIDGADSRDFDDAVYACADEDPENEGGMIVMTAIADVTHFVRPGGPLDREARARGFSIYGANRAEHMLPEILSEDLCSLKPHEDRLAVITTLKVDADGNVIGHYVDRGVIRSHARLTYDEVDDFLCGNDNSLDPQLHGHIASLDAAYQILKDAGIERDELEIDMPKIIAVPDEAGDIEGFKHIRKIYSRDLIEKLMVATNATGGEDLARDGVEGVVYRCHDEPCPVRTARARGKLVTLGFDAPDADGEDISWTSGQLNGLLAQSRSEDETATLRDIVLSLISKSHYGIIARPHFGLAVPAYAHLTSPIRRYADLVNQRAYLENAGLIEAGEANPPETRPGALAAHLNAREDFVDNAHDALMRRYVLAWLEKQGETTLPVQAKILPHAAGIGVTFPGCPQITVPDQSVILSAPCEIADIRALDARAGTLDLALRPSAPAANIAAKADSRREFS